MPAAQRIYIIKIDGKERMFRASHPNQVYSYLTRSLGSVRPATPSDVERLMGAGTRVEETKESPKASTAADAAQASFAERLS